MLFAHTLYSLKLVVRTERGVLNELDLSGKVTAQARATPQLSFLHFDQWKTALSEIQDFVCDERMSPGVLGLVLQLLQGTQLTPNSNLIIQEKITKHILFDRLPHAGVQFYNKKIYSVEKL